MLAAIAIAPQFAVPIPRSVYLSSLGPQGPEGAASPPPLSLSRWLRPHSCPGPPSPTCRPDPVLPPGPRGPSRPPSGAVRCGTRATAPAVTPRILDGRTCPALPCPGVSCRQCAIGMVCIFTCQYGDQCSLHCFFSSSRDPRGDGGSNGTRGDVTPGGSQSSSSHPPPWAPCTVPWSLHNVA